MPSIQSFTVGGASESIRTTGAYAVQDAYVGQRFVEFQNDKLPFKTPKGLDFCAELSFLKQDIRQIIGSGIKEPHWGFAKIYSSEVLPSDFAYCFFNGPDMQVILVVLWSPGSRFIIYEGSQNLPLEDKEQRFGILTTPKEKMKTAGIAPVTIEMAEGGFTIIDGRVRWTPLTGHQIAIGYASGVEIKIWGKVELPDTIALRNKVQELSAQGLNTNFVFVKQPQRNS